MILDAPPVLATTEPIMLAHIVDQVLMVVEADRTAHSAIKSALDLLEPCDNVSLILNKAVGSKSAEQFGSYYTPGLRGKAAGSPEPLSRQLQGRHHQAGQANAGGPCCPSWHCWHSRNHRSGHHPR